MPHTILGLPTINARTGGGADVGRDRWTLSRQFTFFETVDPELMIVHPMGILITYVRGDRALVPQTAGGVSHPPLPLFAVVVRVCRPRPADTNRASGAGRDGSDPPFFTAGAVRQGGGVPPSVPPGVPSPPPVGRSLPSVCIPAGRLPGPRAGRTTSSDERPHA